MIIYPHLLLVFLFFLFSSCISAFVRTGSITKIPHIPYDYSYSIFSSKYKLQLILLCDKAFKRACNEKQELLSQVQKIYDSSHVGVAVIEAKNIKEIPRERLIYEGFPSIHYASLLPPFERELLTFNINKDSLNRFIKSKLDPFKKQIASEEALIQSLNANSATRAIVIVGNSLVPDDVLFCAAKIGEVRLIYEIKGSEYMQRVNKGKEGIAVYYKTKGNGYEHKSIAVDRHTGKTVLANKVLFAFKSGLNRDLNQLAPFDLMLALEKNIPSLIYLYNTISDFDYIKEKISQFIQKEEDRISFSRASITDDLLAKFNVKKALDINDTMLPGFLCLIPNVYDDVLKYYIPFSQGRNITGRLEDVFTHSNHIERIQFTDNKKTLNAIKAHIEKKEEFLLLICSNKILKYRRISQRIKRTLTQIRSQILYEEIDPFSNEITFMTYDYVPTVAFIKPSKTSQEVVINKLETDFSSEAILTFIKAHSTASFEPLTPLSSSLIAADNEHPLYPVHKSRYEKRLLSKGSTVTSNCGLKRAWWSLKAQGSIVKAATDQKYLSDYLGFSDEDYEKKDYAHHTSKKHSIQPKTDL